MSFLDFYAAHPWLGTILLLVLVLVVDSIGVDVVRTVAALRGTAIVVNKLKDRTQEGEAKRP